MHIIRAQAGFVQDRIEVGNDLHVDTAFSFCSGAGRETVLGISRSRQQTGGFGVLKYLVPSLTFRNTGYNFLVDRDDSSLYYPTCCLLRATKVAGLYHAILDVFFPIALLSKAPHHFSKRAPYRIVAVGAVENDQGRKFGDERNAMSGSSLESVLRQLFLTDTATRQGDSGATRTLVRLIRLVKAIRRHKRGLECGPARLIELPCCPARVPLGFGYQRVRNVLHILADLLGTVRRCIDLPLEAQLRQ